MSILCGFVTPDGTITSNGNFSCTYDAGQQKYTIDYNGNAVNPVPVISSTIQSIGVTTSFYPYTGGFTFQAFVNNVPMAGGFNFVVGQI